MSETTTTKPVNLYQLGLEIGGNPSFRMVDEDGTVTIRSSAAQAALDAAVKAHVADPARVPPPSPEATQEANETQFIGARIQGVLTKARAVMADPQVSTDFTAVERKVILAALVLDLAQRRR